MTAEAPVPPIVASVAAAVKRLKDPKRPTKTLRITKEHHAALLDAVQGKQRESMFAEFTMSNGIVCPPGAFGHWDGMRFVIVTGHNDLEVPHGSV